MAEVTLFTVGAVSKFLLQINERMLANPINKLAERKSIANPLRPEGCRLP